MFEKRKEFKNQAPCAMIGSDVELRVLSTPSTTDTFQLLEVILKTDDSDKGI